MAATMRMHCKRNAKAMLTRSQIPEISLPHFVRKKRRKRLANALAGCRMILSPIWISLFPKG